ncbi:hypothetical protein BST65_20700 [Bradyrhizobium canariense]|nr:hypothetical protein BST65_20700 [Bradyrhizobium canariense]OSI31011.1 hypothetical protein BST66_21145 [Bradyrhizobium canariense]OSI39916.1 hypothetical protein BSZ20_28695 [Bradyrhizobium canariense]OSI48206.1 hypothetical protein BST67_19175 [Bradyrhizobium canariense]OSI50091.1 hypothetical protein BSZ15_34030 [Bradyrhizobium canariense]
MLIVTVLAIPHGIAFNLMPDLVAASYGLSPSPDVALAGRLFGGALLAWGGMLWSARNFRDDGAVRAVLVCTCIPEIIGLLTVVMATMAGTMNTMGWIAALIYLFGAAGCGYFLLTQPRLSAA